jgi:hypothetical protein
MYIELANGSATMTILLKNVLYAPSMGLTLIAISQVAAAGYTVVFRNEHCRIFDPKKERVGEIPVQNGLYRVTHAKTSEVATAGNREVDHHGFTSPHGACSF